MGLSGGEQWAMQLPWGKSMPENTQVGASQEYTSKRNRTGWPKCGEKGKSNRREGHTGSVMGLGGWQIV